MSQGSAQLGRTEGSTQLGRGQRAQEKLRGTLGLFNRAQPGASSSLRFYVVELSTKYLSQVYCISYLG